jgi:hypothetical protein
MREVAQFQFSAQPLPFSFRKRNTPAEMPQVKRYTMLMQTK